MVDVSAMAFIQRLGFVDILLWLLTFAVVYGVLSQVKIPKSREAQAIIAIVMGFLVLMAVPTSMVTFISGISTSLILVGLGLLMLLVFFEVAGLGEDVMEFKEGKSTGKKIRRTFLSKHPYVFGIAMIIIAVLIFIGAGGLKLMGLNVPTGYSLVGIMFFIMIMAAIMWMVFSKEEEH
jgi:uncharacterized membrane protein